MSIQYCICCFLRYPHQHSILWFCVLAPSIYELFWSASLLNQRCMSLTITFSVPKSPLITRAVPPYFSTVSRKQPAITRGLLFVKYTFNHRIFLLKPHIQPCMQSPNGFSLSYPSMCHVKFGPGTLYDRLMNLLAVLCSTPSVY